MGENDAKVICVFCNAEQPLDVEASIFGVCVGCDTCGYGTLVDVVVVVKCAECGKVIYKKECDDLEK